MEILSGILNDRHPERDQDASLRFSKIALRLLTPAECPALIPAFRDKPVARETLRKLIDCQTCLARLRPFLPH